MSHTLEMLRLSLAAERPAQFLREHPNVAKGIMLAVQMEDFASFIKKRGAFGHACEAEDMLFVKFLEWEEKQ